MSIFKHDFFFFPKIQRFLPLIQVWDSTGIVSITKPMPSSSTSVKGTPCCFQIIWETWSLQHALGELQGLLLAGLAPNTSIMRWNPKPQPPCKGISLPLHVCLNWTVLMLLTVHHCGWDQPKTVYHLMFDYYKCRIPADICRSTSHFIHLWLPFKNKET